MKFKNWAIFIAVMCVGLQKADFTLWIGTEKKPETKVCKTQDEAINFIKNQFGSATDVRFAGDVVLVNSDNQNYYLDYNTFEVYKKTETKIGAKTETSFVKLANRKAADKMLAFQAALYLVGRTTQGAKIVPKTAKETAETLSLNSNTLSDTPVRFFDLCGNEIDIAVVIVLMRNTQGQNMFTINDVKFSVLNKKSGTAVEVTLKKGEFCDKILSLFNEATPISNKVSLKIGQRQLIAEKKQTMRSAVAGGYVYVLLSVCDESTNLI